jgi:hypothetical protein
VWQTERNAKRTSGNRHVMQMTILLYFLLRGCITESLLEAFKTEAETISKFNPVHKKETQLSIKLLLKMKLLNVNQFNRKARHLRDANDTVQRTSLYECDGL